MSWSTLEQLREHSARLRKPALDREDAVLNEKYAGQYVAYLDDWNAEYELTRTVLVATPDRAEFDRIFAELKSRNGRVKGVAIAPAEPLPPRESRESTEAKLKELTKKTPAQWAAFQRAYDALCEKYPGQWVAYIDEWNGEELTRTVVAAAVHIGPYHEQFQKLAADVRGRVEQTRVPDPNVFEVPSVWFE